MISNTENRAEFLKTMRQIETNDEPEPHSLAESVRNTAEVCDSEQIAVALDRMALTIPATREHDRALLLVAAEVIRLQSKYMTQAKRIIEFSIDSFAAIEQAAKP